LCANQSRKSGWLGNRVQILGGASDGEKLEAHRDSREYMRRMLGVHTMPCRSGCPEAPCTADVGASPSRVYSALMSSCKSKISSEHRQTINLMLDGQ
jgi:hypothetical protein